MPKGKSNKKIKAPKIAVLPNNGSASAADYAEAWVLEYERLTEAQKLVIDNARTESIHGAYTRHYFVENFVNRVIDLVENVAESN